MDVGGIFASAQSFTKDAETQDVHICGSCRSNFPDIHLFIRHKRNGCSSPISSTVSDTIPLADLLRPPETEPTAAVLSPPDVTAHLQPPIIESRGSSQTPPKNSAGSKSKQNAGVSGTVLLPASIKTSKCDNAVSRSKKFLCTFEGCKYSTSYPKDLQRHSMTHSGERPFSCNTCSKNFSRLDKLKTHERQHSGHRPYKCTLCAYAAADSSSLKKHHRVHSDERPYRCQMCQYASRNSSQLTVHLRTHTGDAPFKCQYCPSKFKINSDLTRHVRLHTGEKPYACTICDFRCTIKNNLNTHIRTNHSTENLRRCLQCDFSTPSRKLLRQHQKVHLPDVVKCTQKQCDYMCRSEAALRKHALVHLEERPYKCKHCNYSSRQPGNVRTHIKKRHADKGKLERLRRLGRKSKLKKPDQSSESSNDVSLSLAPPITQSESSDVGANCHVSPTTEINSDISHGGCAAVTNSRLQPLCVRAFQCQECDAAFVREDSLRSHVRQHQRRAQQVPTTAATVNVAVQAAGDDGAEINAAIQANDITTSTSYANPCDLLLAAAAVSSSSTPSGNELSEPQKTEFEGSNQNGSRLVKMSMLPPTSTVLCFQQTPINTEVETILSDSPASVLGTSCHDLRRDMPTETILLNAACHQENGIAATAQLLYHVQTFQPTNVVQYMLQAGPTDQRYLFSASPGDGSSVSAAELVYVPGTAESPGAYFQVGPSSVASSAPQLLNYVVANGGALSAEGGSMVMTTTAPGGYTFQLVDDSTQQQQLQAQSQSAVVLCSADCHESHPAVVYTTGSGIPASTADSTMS